MRRRAAGYLGAVGPQHHLLCLGFGEGIGHAVEDAVRRVLVAPEESKGRRNKQEQSLLPRFREGMFELAKKEHRGRKGRRRSGWRGLEPLLQGDKFDGISHN